MLATVGSVLLIPLPVAAGYLGILPGFLCWSLGASIGFPALAIAGLAGTKHGEEGLASGLIQTSQRLGFPFGLVPGSPSVACTFTSYAAEKRWANDRDEFGRGAISGVAGPETANNSMQISAMVPLLSFGIPSGATTAIVLGAFLIHGLQPGPLLYRDHPDIAWGIIAGLFVSNFILLILSLPAVRLWVMVLKIPYGILGSITLAVMTVGAYTINNSVFEVGVLWVSGIIGLLFRRLDVPLTPMALTLVLGPILEQKFRTALSVDPSVQHFLFGDAFATTCFGLMILILTVKVSAPLRGRFAARVAPARG